MRHRHPSAAVHRRAGTARTVLLAAACLLLLQALPVQAQHLGAALRAGTRGVTVGVTVPVVPTLNARVDASLFSYGTDGTELVDDVNVDWEAEGTLLFASALADWHPFANGFRLSGGLAYNGLEGKGGFVPAENIEVGTRTYTPSEVGGVDAEVSFGSKIAPYMGLGFGNPLSRRVGFTFDLGVLYVGSPDVTLDASGMLTPTEGEAAQIEQNLSWIQWYPVVSIGLSARLF